ncbi:MAG: TonB-dependent receptor [Fibrobacterota bacterium]|nr:TonB-dependent receptor [Fibrobacterota bacterium]
MAEDPSCFRQGCLCCSVVASLILLRGLADRAWSEPDSAMAVTRPALTKADTSKFSEPVLELPDAVATAKRPVRLNSTLAQSTLSGKELDRTRGNSLGDALEALPGVTVLRTGSTMAKPVIRGLQGDRIVIMNNGVRQEGQQWGLEHVPEIDPFLASRLTVVKGASSVRYGADAMGGAVLVEPWPLRSKHGYGGEVHLAGFSNNGAGAASATAEGGSSAVPGLGWRLQGTARKGGNSATPEYRLNNTAFEESAFSTALGITRPKAGMEFFYSRFHSELGLFSGSHIGSLSDLAAALNREAPLVDAPFSYDIARPSQDVTHHLVKVRGNVKASEKSTLNATYALQHNIRAEYDHKPLNDKLAARNLPELEYRITTETADLAWDHRPMASVNTSLGTKGIMQFNLYHGRPFIPNFFDAGGGVFGTVHWEQGAWEAEGGARYDYKFLRAYKRVSGEVVNRAFEFANPSGMLGGAFHPRNEIALKLHLSTAFRPPGVNELFSEGLHHGAAAIEIGDPELQPERAYDINAAVEWKGPGRLRGEFSAYYNYIRDFIQLVPSRPPTLTIRGAFPTFRYRQSDASFKGVEGGFHLTLLKGFSYAAKGSLLRAVDEATGDYLILMPADRVENGLEWDLKSLWGLHALHASFSVQKVFKQTHAPADSLDYAPPPEGYALVRARVGFSLPLQTGSLDFDLEAANLLDASYRDYSNRFRYYADDPGRNITLRIKAPFEIQNPVSGP